MKSIALLTLIAALAAACSGCQVSGEIENQAYVLALGLDTTEDGRLELTARIPKIGRSDAASGDGDAGGSPYLVFTAAGSDWGRALEALQLATPREVNLSHIELIVASEALAGSGEFPELMNRVAETPHLYTTARFAVCDGSARAFIEAQKTIIGTRLSAELRAMLTHYAAKGYVPDSSFAEVCFSTGSFYSDPVAIRAGLVEGADAASDAASESSADERRILASPMRQLFSGAALFREGVLVARLDAERTKLLSLIRGETRSICVEYDGRTVELTLESGPKKRVSTDGELSLSLDLPLSTLDGLGESDAQALERRLRASVEALIAECQALEVDPFGFADIAASHFWTTQDWLDYRWRERFARAEVRIRVSIRPHVARQSIDRQ